jgi:hypothetical protein
MACIGMSLFLALEPTSLVNVEGALFLVSKALAYAHPGKIVIL